MSVRIEWTFEEARDAQADYQANGGLLHDPTGPLYQWSALHGIEKERARFDAGDNMALLAAIRKCANHGLVMPEWVSLAFIRNYDAVLSLRMRSWDDAFGRPYRKGMDLKAARFRREKRFHVWMEVNRRHLAGEAIDDQLFEAVGEALGMKKTLASQLYYEAKNLMPVLPRD